MSSLKSQSALAKKSQVWLALLTAFVGGAAVFAGYRPQAEELRKLADQTSQTQQQLRAGETQTRNLPSIAADVQHLHVELEKAKSIARQHELPKLIGQIAQIGETCKLTNFELKPGTPVHEDQLNQLPVQLSFEGDFLDVCQFVKHVEQLNQLTRVRALDSKVRDKSGNVRTSLTLVIYFATE